VCVCVSVCVSVCVFVCVFVFLFKYIVLYVLLYIVTYIPDGFPGRSGDPMKASDHLAASCMFVARSFTCENTHAFIV
jgi:hypothetical protein